MSVQQVNGTDRNKMPTADAAKKDAIASLVDSITSNLASHTSALRKAADKFDETALAHAGRVKLELETFVDTIDELAEDVSAITEKLDRKRAEHAKLVNTRVSE